MQGDRAVNDGDLDAAYACYEASLAAFDRADDALGRSIPLRALAALAILQADFPAAQVLFQESLASLKRVRTDHTDSRDLAVRLSLQGLALIAAAEGRAEDAAHLAEAEQHLSLDHALVEALAA
jgi:hypothetical protein